MQIDAYVPRIRILGFLVVIVISCLGAVLLFSAPELSAQQSGLCNLIASGESVSTGFGVPWSTLSSSRPLLLNSQCNDDEALLRAGTGSTLEYIYKTGYTWDGTAWDPITFSGSQLIANTWYVGDAYHVLADIPSGTTFWVGYVCTWTGSVWKCGCRDNSCATSYWQLQGVDPSNVTAGGGGGTAQGDDTFACLATGSGPTVKVSGDFGYTSFRSGSYAPGTKFDARTAKWKSEGSDEDDPNGGAYNHKAKNRLPIYIAPGQPTCWAGGVMEGTSDRNLRWCDTKQSLEGPIEIRGGNMILDGFRADNHEEGARVYVHPDQFTVKNTWISYARGDCFENDGHAGGLIDDSLFDGCQGTFFSATNPGSKAADGSNLTATIQSSIVRMQNMPGTHVGYLNQCQANDKFGYQGIFKLGAKAPKFKLQNNVFYLEKPRDYNLLGSVLGGNRIDKLAACSDNLLIWPGNGAWPDKTWEEMNKKFPNCLKVIKDAGVYEKIKKNWINCHPKVGRVPGDPQSNASQCQSNAYGGGQGGTAIPN